MHVEPRKILEAGGMSGGRVHIHAPCMCVCLCVGVLQAPHAMPLFLLPVMGNIEMTKKQK